MRVRRRSSQEPRRKTSPPLDQEDPGKTKLGHDSFDTAKLKELV